MPTRKNGGPLVRGGKKHLSTIPYNNGGPLSPARSPTRSRTPPPAAGFGGSSKGVSSVRNGNSAAGGAVFVHGAREDTSWWTQIGRLRE